VKIFEFLGPRTHPSSPIEMKVRLAKRNYEYTCPSAVPNFTWIGATSRPWFSASA